ncbi:FAD-binding protein [Chenggangzhangella methanolivorans]|uniref:FAD-binding protein n=1 Tax=Chenggangzhangella methanolivorans TaxID=1437009 RepID=A0A9E6RD45_9HYPH|nr:FAD-binding protein [Chenggangzhangella methanolivorans]QZO02155.1 FAD-binding protein [Chenggangzhangella methanolivorans]
MTAPRALKDQVENLEPADEKELAEILSGCAAFGEKLRVVGGGTRIEPAFVEARRQLSTRRQTGIVDYEPGELTLIARAGTPVAEIEAAVAAQGQSLAFEPPDHRRLLGAKGKSTIGGVVAANASGPRRVLAGACRDHLLGIRFVDGRGRVLKSGGRVMKNVTGLDLGKLLCGSHGALGVLTEVALKTLPEAPRQRTIAFFNLDARAAAGIFAKALATPYEVSGAAFHAGVAWLRIEGWERQVIYRVDRLLALLGGRDSDVIKDDGSRLLWRALRDFDHFAASQAPVWRILVKPTDAPAATAALEALGLETSMDWGGGLIWCSGEAASARLRSALPGGHATLVRRGSRPAAEASHPLSAPVEALSSALRRTFDPAAILNPGLMGF